MINPSELRRGNLISTVLGYAQILSVPYEGDFGGLGSMKCLTKKEPNLYRLEKIEPITITEEWLIKLGFERKNNYPNEILAIRDERYLGCWLGISKSLFENWTFYKGSWIDNKVNIVEIKHIHQLQNIYFDISGKELILNIKQ